VPANRDGLGYVCYSRQGQDRALAPGSHGVTQDFEGAADLDLAPCTDGRTVSAGRIWCAAGSPIAATPELDRTGWSADTKVEFELFGPDSAPKAAIAVTEGSHAAALQARAAAEGFYTLRVTASHLPASKPALPYKLSVRYTAPKDFAAAQPVAADPAKVGQWSPVFALKNVAIHAHLLPTGQVLYWGRRREVGSLDFKTLNDHDCQTYLLDPASEQSHESANQPTLKDGTTVNLFCSGHAFLPDGRLMVMGGHEFDSQGVNQSCTFDPKTQRWTAEATMNHGRWYPSAVTLADGGVLVLSGSFATGPLQPPPNSVATNSTPQVWRGAGWESLADFGDGLPLFPRFHVEPQHGHVFMSGPQGQSFFLDTQGPGKWIPGPSRALALRDYAPSVMYDTGKVLFVGGGNDKQGDQPTNAAETIDLTAAQPAWRTTSPMHFRRRQHNATILADGTVLVVGGTQGPGFNDVDPGAPIHAAELWDPDTGTWTVLAEEAVDRCYHSTALLLPDGRVLSGGGGEYAPVPNVANPARDTHADAQFFSPPYLFRGARPTFTGAPDAVSYGQAFELAVPQADRISKVTWIRLGSVTHSCDQNQRLNKLAFSKGPGKVTVTAPANANLSPPGHYMLFLVDDRGVPSVGHIARIAAAPHVAMAVQEAPLHAARFNEPRPGPVDKDRATVAAAVRPAITVGITPTCPYGLAGCWGGAKGALHRLTGVATVLEEANAFTSTAAVFLVDDRLPDLDLWRDEFARFANASYAVRGIEVTLTGSLEQSDGQIWLSATADRPAVRLAPIDPGNKVQWDFATKAPLPLASEEASAYARLLQAFAGRAAPAANAVAGTVTGTVTGPLLKGEHGFHVEVRDFTL
jgi:hypothetical protein